TGTVEENRAMKLGSRVVLDRDARANAAFAAYGTPMAVLIDGSGRIASELVIGAEAVMRLTRSEDLERSGSSEVEGADLPVVWRGRGGLGACQAGNQKNGASLLSCAHADRGRLPGLAPPDFRDGCGNQGAQGQRLDDRHEKELADDFTKETGNQVSVEQRIKAGRGWRRDARRPG